MSQELSTSFVELPATGKHNKILYEGHQLNFDRTTNAGKKFWRCKRHGCTVNKSLYKYRVAIKPGITWILTI